MKNYELQQIMDGERAAFSRRQSAWKEYISVERRFGDTCFLLALAMEDLDSAKRRLDRGCENEIGLEIASRRHESAKEEFYYQKKEHERVKAELKSAQSDYEYWSELYRSKLAEARITKACG